MMFFPASANTTMMIFVTNVSVIVMTMKEVERQEEQVIKTRIRSKPMMRKVRDYASLLKVGLKYVRVCT